MTSVLTGDRDTQRDTGWGGRPRRTEAPSHGAGHGSHEQTQRARPRAVGGQPPLPGPPPEAPCRPRLPPSAHSPAQQAGGPRAPQRKALLCGGLRGRRACAGSAARAAAPPSPGPGLSCEPVPSCSPATAKLSLRQVTAPSQGPAGATACLRGAPRQALALARSRAWLPGGAGRDRGTVRPLPALAPTTALGSPLPTEPTGPWGLRPAAQTTWPLRKPAHYSEAIIYPRDAPGTAGPVAASSCSHRPGQGVSA